jgi:hypothetical protein
MYGSLKFEMIESLRIVQERDILTRFYKYIGTQFQPFSLIISFFKLD